VNKQVKRAQVELQSEALTALARTAIRRGQKLATVTKLAADAETVAYWSEYFGAYGTMFVRPASLKKLASLDDKAAWDSSDDEWYQKELEKQKEEEAKGKTSALSPEQLEAVVEVVQALDVKSDVKNAQVMYDVAVRVEAAPDVALLPDAFEHTFKFALGAVKPSGVAHVSVDHVFVDIDGESMVGQAVCGVSLTSGDLNAFVTTLKSQLEKYLKDADFPSSVQVEEPLKRVAGRNCIMQQALAGVPLIRLASQFGRGPALVARRCAERQVAGVPFSPIGRAQAKFAQAMIESAESLAFEGEPSSEKGAFADCGDGIHAQIKYQGTAIPKGFQWMIAQGDEVLDQGESEIFDEARGDIQAALPDARSKAQAAKAALKQAMTAALGPVSSFEKLASVGGTSEYKVETKTGRTAWVSVEGGKVVNKVGEL
jgi:hypothetical protein